jgi:hypothetical protein
LVVEARKLLAAEAAEQERIERERAEEQRAKRERQRAERAEREREKQERSEREKAERERAEKERAERRERERQEKSRMAREQAAFAERKRREKVGWTRLWLHYLQLGGGNPLSDQQLPDAVKPLLCLSQSSSRSCVIVTWMSFLDPVATIPGAGGREAFVLSD